MGIVKNLVVVTWNGGDELPYSHVYFDLERNFDLLLFNNSGKSGETERHNGVEYDHYITEKTENKGQIFFHLCQYLSKNNLEYNYVGVIDDDIIFKVSDFNYMLHIANIHGLDVFQPSISKDSYFSHRKFVHRPGQMVTNIDWVEIMAPFYRQNLLMACEPYFNKTISGQGVDCFLMPVLQIIHQQTNTAIVHAVQIKHARPIRSHQRIYQNGLNNEQEIEIIRKASLDLAEMSENKNKFNNSFKRLVLKEGNKFLIQLEIDLHKLQNAIKNLVILLKEFSHY